MRDEGRASKLACALLVAAGCGGQAGEGGLQAPRDLRVSEAVFDRVVLSWTPSTSDPAAWYDLEEAEGSGSFHVVMNGIPSRATGHWTQLADRSAELTTFTYRVRTCVVERPEVVCSDWRVATHARGVRPPTLRATVSGAMVQLEWTNNSTVASVLALERIDTAPDSSERRVVAIPLAPHATAYTDREFLGERVYQYRLRAGKDGTWSAPASTDTFRIVGLASGPINVEQLPEGTRVSWEPPLPGADYQWVTGWPAVGATVSASDTWWTDFRRTLWPIQEYWVSAARAGDGAPASSPHAAVTPFTVEDAGLTLAASELAAPGAPLGRDAQGGWWAWSDAGVHRQVGASWESTSPEPLLVGAQGYVLDGAGRPHRLGASGDSTTALLHQWWNGAPGWAAEAIPTPGRNATDRGSFALDPTGAIHALYTRPVSPGVLADQVLHVWRAGDAWIEEQLPLAAADFGSHRAVLAGDGTLFAAVAPQGFSSGWVTLCTRPPAAAWSCAATTVRGGASVAGLHLVRFGLVIVLRGDAGSGVCAQLQGAWRCEGLNGGDPSAPPAVTVSPDGARLVSIGFDTSHVEFSGGKGSLTLEEWDGATLTRRYLAPPTGPLQGGATLAIGFVGGRLWATASLDRESGARHARWEQIAP